MDHILSLGASLRLSRLITTDFIGEWWVKDPVDRAMDRYEATHQGHPEPWWWKYRSGLDCPFCVGFWLGAGVLAVTSLSRGTALEAPVRFAKTALAMNYVVGHLSSRVDGEDD